MEHIATALMEADWKPELLERRLRLFEQRCAGIPMEQIAEELGVSRRTAFYDWDAISKVLSAAAAPELELIRSKADARLERVFTLLMAEVATARNARRSPVQALREARAVIMDQATLRGAVDRRSFAVIAAAAETEGLELARKTDAELVEMAKHDLVVLSDLAGAIPGGSNGTTNGNGNGDGA